VVAANLGKVREDALVAVAAIDPATGAAKAAAVAPVAAVDKAAVAVVQAAAIAEHPGKSGRV
jgi:hypothetical protein